MGPVLAEKVKDYGEKDRLVSSRRNHEMRQIFLILKKYGNKRFYPYTSSCLTHSNTARILEVKQNKQTHPIKVKHIRVNKSCYSKERGFGLWPLPDLLITSFALPSNGFLSSGPQGLAPEIAVEDDPPLPK